MIFKIFKRDLKGLSRNILALAIALGLCLIPSLYAWFNIYSNWDPYANTASVQIAIVSEDEGYSESDDSTINMGEQIVEQLHSNDKLGWRFPETKDEAMNKLNAGSTMPLSLLVRTFHEACMTSLTMVLIHQQLHIMRIPRKMLLLPRLQIQEKALFRTLSIPNSLMCVLRLLCRDLTK